jgi:hypothetical protein
MFEDFYVVKLFSFSKPCGLPSVKAGHHFLYDNSTISVLTLEYSAGFMPLTRSAITS